MDLINFNNNVIGVNSLSESFIHYSIYENSTKKNTIEIFTKPFSFDKNFIPSHSASIAEIEDIQINSFLIQEHPGFFAKQNSWLLDNKTIRLIMETSFILSELIQKTDFAQIMQSVIDNNAVNSEKFIFKEKGETVVYLEEIYSEHIELIESLPIIIERKIL